MRLGLIAETPKEYLAHWLNLVPVPAADTVISLLKARVLMVAVRHRVFDVLANGESSTAETVSCACGLNEKATKRLLDILVSFRYLRARSGRYELTAMTRKWLVTASPTKLVQTVSLAFTAWEWAKHIDEFVLTGVGFDAHGTLTESEWITYQASMKEMSRSASQEASRRAPVPSGAKRMLDIGGAHGLDSVELCRRHPGLSAVVLDLPDAVRASAPLLAEEGMGDRVLHKAGNALTEDFGIARWDVVWLSAILHHIERTHIDGLMNRVAAALRPGGVCVIIEQIRADGSADADRPENRLGALLDLLTASTSRSGIWSLAELQHWQTQNGLSLRRPIWLRSAPGVALLAATKPRR